MLTRHMALSSAGAEGTGKFFLDRCRVSGGGVQTLKINNPKSTCSSPDLKLSHFVHHLFGVLRPSPIGLRRGRQDDSFGGEGLAGAERKP